MLRISAAWPDSASNASRWLPLSFQRLRKTSASGFRLAGCPMPTA